VRYAIYAAASGALLLLMTLGVAALGADHPLVTRRDLFLAACLGGMALACAARSVVLSWDASGFERLEPHEVADLPRRLCPGMIRSDVVDELSRRGWRAGKIRTVLMSLAPRPD